MHADQHLLSTLSERILKFGSAPPHNVARAELYAALDSKWEGIAVAAARSLCKWGDSESIEMVKLKLEKFAALPAHWHVSGTISAALLPHLGADDLPWIIDLCFSKANPHNRFSIYTLFSCASHDLVLLAIDQRIGSSEFGCGDLRQFRSRILAASHRKRA